MATKYSSPSKKEVYAYPSHFGSHASMVDKEKTEKLASPMNVVVKDEYGYYITEGRRLDDGLADTNRYNFTKRKFDIEKNKELLDGGGDLLVY
jgi:hypothetical protein